MSASEPLDPFRIDPETFRALEALQLEQRGVRMHEAFAALVELRRRFGPLQNFV